MKRQVKATEEVQKLYCHLGMPDYKRFLTMLQHVHIKTVYYYGKWALTFFGRDIAHLKGKETRAKGAKIPIRDVVPFPQSVIDTQGFVHLSVIFFTYKG